MSRETQFKEIDGHKYSCTMMPVRKAHQTWIELVTVLGQPVVSAIVQASSNQEQDAGRLLSAAAEMAMMNLQGDVSERLLANIYDGVHVEGVGELKPWDGDFETHFHGQTFTLYKVWAWAVGVNYYAFLDGAQNLGLGQMLAKGKTALRAHLTQTSESGTPSSPNTSQELDS